MKGKQSASGAPTARDIWRRSQPTRTRWLHWSRLHLGWPALAGCMMLAGAAACWGLWWPQVLREQAALAARERALAAAPRAPLDALTQRALETLSPDDMPPLRQRGSDLEALVGAAKRHGLTLERADYSAGSPLGGRLERVEAALPLTGTYAQLRPFIATVLNELPHAALDSLQMERQNSHAAQLQVQAKWVLFYREDAR